MGIRKALIGFSTGVILTLVGVGVWSMLGGSDAIDEADRSGDTATTSAPQSPVTAGEPVPWFDPTEVVFESTVLIPTALTVRGGFATLEYEVRSLAPLGGFPGDHPDEPVPVALPELWELTTVAGEEMKAEVDEDAGRVQFRVAETATPEDVASVDVVGWRLAAPIAESQALAARIGASVEFAGGTTLSVDTIIEQSTSTIVQVDVSHPDEVWDEVFAVPVDPRWRVAGRQEGGLQFIWEGAGAPDTVGLIQGSPTWVPAAGRLTVWSST